MTVIVTGSNVVVGGIRVPVGVVEWPAHGVITCYGGGFTPTNVSVGAGDLLAVEDLGVRVVQGYDPWQAVGAGFVLVVVGLGAVGMVRRLMRVLAGTNVTENI